MRGRVAVFAAIIVLLGSSPAWAQDAQDDPEPPPPPAHFGGQRSFGFGPAAGLSNGLGALVGVQLAPPATLWISGGYTPLLIFGNRLDDEAMTLDVYGAWQAGADLALTPWHAGSRYDFGVILGYRYNGLLGNGGGAGAVLTVDLNARLALFFSIEYLVFPQADANLASVQYPSDRQASVPWLQGGGNVGLVVYP